MKIQPVAVPLSELGESPFWHAGERALYWCDIAGKALHRYQPAGGGHRSWPMPSEPGCCAPAIDGSLVLALRDGFYRLQPRIGRLTLLAAALHDPAEQRYNDGRCDAAGRFWVGTVFEPKTAPAAGLFRLEGGPEGLVVTRQAGDVTTANGLAFSPDGRTMYWTDTPAHRIDRFDFDLASGAISNRREFARFPPRDPGTEYGGRPDGACVDRDGNYWVAMYEGGRLLQLSPAGKTLQAVEMPVRCPTMPCFGDDDHRTLYITSARRGRSAEELASTPLAGSVFALRLEVPGLPVEPFRA